MKTDNLKNIQKYKKHRLFYDHKAEWLEINLKVQKLGGEKQLLWNNS